MKVKVVGCVHRKGVSKKTGKEFNACFVSVTYPQKDYVGLKAEELYISMETLGGVIPEPGKEYNLEYNRSGFIDSFTPSMKFGDVAAK